MDAILQGRWILVVEDQPLVALDIADCLTKAGAAVLTAATLQEGLPLAEHSIRDCPQRSSISDCATATVAFCARV
jgi:CheY-like chemotaxis protein